MQKVLFIDRDGTLIQEAEDQMLNEIHKFRLLPMAIHFLSKIVRELDYVLVMVSNQDGLGTDTFPEKQFWPLQSLLMDTLASEGIHFDAVIIDRHYDYENSPFRKPGTALLTKYMNGAYDLANSFVIGDRWSDIELAHNLQSKGILIQSAYSDEPSDKSFLKSVVALQCKSWSEIYTHLIQSNRKASIQRNTSETKINVLLDLDGKGYSNIHTGLHFFDHMLEQIAKHGELDLEIQVVGDLHIDEHHTIEDTAIALGQALYGALGKKAGIERYGFCLPMDDCLAQVALDFGGRPWLEWDVKFVRESIGQVPTEMFYHFFKSLADNARCNLNIKAEGENEHHKIEAIFKALARAIKMAKRRDLTNMAIPSSKGSL